MQYVRLPNTAAHSSTDATANAATNATTNSATNGATNLPTNHAAYSCADAYSNSGADTRPGRLRGVKVEHLLG